MSKRFGRNQRRRAREDIQRLNEHVRILSNHIVNEPHADVTLMKELLEALEECVNFCRNLDGVSSEYIGEIGEEFVAGDITDLIARAKAAING